MGTIKQLSDRFKALNFELIKQEALRETAPIFFPELNREQLKEGKKSDGNLITPNLDNVAYALKKETLNGLNGRSLLTPDLKNTGDFYADITTTITAKTIKTFSLDIKSPALELKYTPYIFGLNTTNLSKYAKENLQPVLMAKLKAATVG